MRCPVPVCVIRHVRPPPSPVLTPYAPVLRLCPAPLPPWDVSQFGATPLWNAASYGHTEAVKALLAAGANKDAAKEVG